MKRPIHISLGPNYEKDDILIALKTLFNPLKWFDKSEVEKLEEEFAKYFEGKLYAVALNSGRSAQYVLLKALGIGKGDEVVVQAFTCVAVPNSVSWTGAKPVYCDIDNTYNLNLLDLENKITKKTKAVIIQNTFGLPADYKNLLSLTKKRKILLIEDGAHLLGNYFRWGLSENPRPAFFSFGRDKVISSVFGGMIVTADAELYEKLKKQRDELQEPLVLWTIQQLLHPILVPLFLRLYLVSLGKLLLFTAQKLHLLSRSVYEEEKSGKMIEYFPQKMSPALAVLANNQVKKIDKFNQQRMGMSQYYYQQLNKLKGVSISKFLKLKHDALRFPIEVENPKSLINFAKKRGIVLSDWYKEVIAPCLDPTVVGYEWGSCPNAESAAKHIVNLPTYPTMTIKDAERVVQTIKQWQATQ